MSIKVMAEVWAHSKAKSTALLVQFALADHANDETRSCWPSVRHIAGKCRTHPDTARRHLHALEELGEISIQDQKGGTAKTSAGRRPNRYVIRSYPASSSRSDSPCKSTTPRVEETPDPAPLQPQAPRTYEPNHKGTVKETSPACSQANDASRKKMHPKGKQILDEFYESRKGTQNPVVVPNWAAASRIIGRYVDKGIEPTRIRAALEIAPNISTGCLNIALAKLAKSDPTNPFTVRGRDPHSDKGRCEPTVDIDPNDPHRRDDRSW